MRRFTTADRDKAMTHAVSFHNVPMPRGLAFAIRHIEAHGAPVDIFSADRRDRIIKVHNREYGTHLSGQQELVDAHQRDPTAHAAANSPSTTSHCYRSDGNPVYKDSKGRPIPPGGKLPWYMLGIDMADKGKREDVRKFLAVAHKLGYEFVQPYKVGSELHHVVLVKSPIPTLEHHHQIDRNRR